MWDKIKKLLDHNQFVATAIVLCLLVVFWVYGCDSQTKSPWDSSVKLTRAQLDAEIERKNADIAIAYADLDKQDLFKQQLFENLSVYASGGAVNPVGVGMGLLGVLGVGAAVDNRRKNTVIKTLKNGTTTPTTA